MRLAGEDFICLIPGIVEVYQIREHWPLGPDPDWEVRSGFIPRWLFPQGGVCVFGMWWTDGRTETLRFDLLTDPNDGGLGGTGRFIFLWVVFLYVPVPGAEVVVEHGKRPTWKTMDVWRTTFLYDPVVYRFHVNLPGRM